MLHNKYAPAARVAAALALLMPGPVRAQHTAAFRPPATPLVTFNPYLSVWSEADNLTDDTPRHWTHREHSLGSLIRIDGKPYRLMGRDPQDVPALPQVGLEVWPTRSIYQFDNGQIHVTLTFTTTALPDDLEALSRPLGYLTWNVRATDGAKHEISIYDSVSSQLAVNTPDEPVEWKRETMGTLTSLRVGTVSQSVLGSAGDDHRIDWGYAYLVAPKAQATSAIGASDALLASFAQTGVLPAQEDARMPRPVSDAQPTLAVAFDLGKVGAEPVSRHVMVGYDEIYAIKYFGHKLRPYWRRNGRDAAGLFQAAEKDYTELARKCEKFDAELMTDLTKAGGARYAQIAALAYRECAAGCGLAADANKQPLYFTKENTSNGDIATVDVIFPMDPIWVFLSPTLAKASLVPILDYAASDHWKFPNAPHDLGTYPIARGTDDGGEGMPVEESGNMLILCDAIAQAESSPAFVNKWWPQLTQWAQYLEKYGLDPEDQLCTDDFMGHLAHNANLSVKAILGLAAYGDLCRMRGDAANAAKYKAEALTDAKHWVEATSDGGHSRLAFDKPNSWSQKYNLVWDQILGLNIFDKAVAKTEVTFYKQAIKSYGVPLDSRTKLTKTDWSLWSATLADNQADFEALISPIYDYLNTTTTRMPLVDSYVTDDIHSEGMRARPVVGGIFIKMLDAPAVWKKWAARDAQKVGPWAAFPKSPLIKEVMASSRNTPQLWKYTTESPSGDWTGVGYDDSGWKEGAAGFGTVGTPGVNVRTTWDNADIWLRRVFVMPSGGDSHLQFFAYHDEDIEIYVNGKLAGKEGGFVTGYTPIPILPSALALLKPGAKITLTVHCHQTGGGQGVDVGLSNITER